MMQSLPIISVNIWHILISLANLLILFLLVKKFLFKPVKAVLEKRQAEIDEQYKAAETAQTAAEENRAAWEDKMASADATADQTIKNAAETATRRADKIVADARAEADGIVRRAEAQAVLERQNAEAAMRREIVEVSTQIAEKMLEREIQADDHRDMIDAFLDRIGDDHD